MTYVDVNLGRTTKPVAEVGRAGKKKDKYLEEHRKKMLKEMRKLGQRKALE